LDIGGVMNANPSLSNRVVFSDIYINLFSFFAEYLLFSFFWVGVRQLVLKDQTVFPHNYVIVFDNYN
jgi:hypothetical protein